MIFSIFTILYDHHFYLALKISKHFHHSQRNAHTRKAVILFLHLHSSLEPSIYSLDLWIYLWIILKINRIIQDMTSWVSLLLLTIFPPNIHPSCTTLSVFDFCIILHLRRNNFQYFTSKYDVNCEFAFVILGSFLVFTEEGCCVLSNAFFPLSFEMILCSSHLCSIYVVYDIGGPLLHSWGKSHLIMVDNLFNTLLDLVWQYFVNVFLLICIHNGYWS